MLMFLRSLFIGLGLFSWSSLPAATAPDQPLLATEITWVGHINGNLPIQMQLKPEANGALKGRYQYVGKTGSLQLEGRLLPDKTIELTERNDQGMITGHFRGQLETKGMSGSWTGFKHAQALAWKVRLVGPEGLGPPLPGQNVEVVMNEFPSGFNICGSYPTLQKQVDPLILQKFNQEIQKWTGQHGWKGGNTERSPSCGGSSGTTTLGSHVSFQSPRVLAVGLGSEYIGAFLNHSSETLVFDLASGKALTYRDFYKGSDKALRKLIRSRWKPSMVEGDGGAQDCEEKLDDFTLKGRSGLSFGVSCFCPPRICGGSVDVSYGDLMVLEGRT